MHIEQTASCREPLEKWHIVVMFFLSLQVVREVYLPRLRCWLAEYPFIDRFEFIKILNTLQSESFDRAQGIQGR